MAGQQREALLALVRDPVEAGGFDLEDVEIAGAGRRRIVRILIDADGGLTLDDIADVTSDISDLLDDSDVLGDNPYTLEVTSPGIDRPLTLPRHWRRNIDRLVKVTFHEGTDITGRIANVEESTVTVDVDGRGHEIALSDVAKAKVQVEFNRKGA